MKAICIRELVNRDPYIVVREGEEVDVTIENDGKYFCVYGLRFYSHAFFYHFKTEDPNVRMSYSDFEYILCNYVYTMAMFRPEVLKDGERDLRIDNWNGYHIYIHCNEKANAIRVIFGYRDQRIYDGYEAALTGICNHE